jgi:hypothetical protein
MDGPTVSVVEIDDGGGRFLGVMRTPGGIRVVAPEVLTDEEALRLCELALGVVEARQRWRAVHGDEGRAA